MEVFWGFLGLGLFVFLCAAGYALVVYIENNEKTPSKEEVSDDKKE